MNKLVNIDQLEVGFDIPAAIGMDASETQAPALVLDLDALERNIKKMGDYAKAHGMRHRVRGKMHKSVDVAKLQVELGGACGICCQKVPEAEVFARDGIKDVLVSNQYATRRRSTGWHRCPNWAHGRSVASTISAMSPTCPRPYSAMAPRSYAWSRSTAARAVAA